MFNISIGRTTLTVLGASLLAAGCGGGGGDAGGPAVSVPTTPVTITATNQDSVSRAAATGAQGGFASSTVGGLSADGRAHALASGGSATTSRPLPSVFAPLALRAFGASTASGRATIAAVSDTGQVACSVSGTSRAVLDDRDNSGTASAGDSVTVSFSNCEDVAGEKVNGTLSMTLTQVTRGSLLSFTASATMASLGVSGNGRSVTYDGDMTLSYVETSTTVTAVQLTVGSQLAVSISTPNYSDTIAMLAGYRIATTEDSAALPTGGGVPGKSTSTASGDVASTSVGGKVTISTPVPVVEYDADDFPSAGQLKATGVSSSVTLTALPTGQIRIDRDDGNDGTIDQSRTVAWAFLF